MKFNKVALSIACAAGFTVAGAAAANADTVTVKSGDTLSQIADERKAPPPRQRSSLKLPSSCEFRPLLSNHRICI